MLYWVTGAVLLVYLLLVWFFAGWFEPARLRRLGIAHRTLAHRLLGAGFTVWWIRRQRAAERSDLSDRPREQPPESTSWSVTHPQN